MQPIETWNPFLTVLTDEDYETDYSSTTPFTGRSYHLGQLKLQVADMIFLINHWDQSLSSNIHLVVAGAVTGEHFASIVELFPMISKIDLWDPKPPSELSLNKPGTDGKNPKIEFISDYLTVEKAATYKGRGNVYFVSDLRTVGLRSADLGFRKENNIPTVCTLPIDLAKKMLKDKFYRVSEEQEQVILSHSCGCDIRLELTQSQLEVFISKELNPEQWRAERSVSEVAPRREAERSVSEVAPRREAERSVSEVAGRGGKSATQRVKGNTYEVPYSLARNMIDNTAYQVTEEQRKKIVSHTCPTTIDIELTGMQVDALTDDYFKVRLTDKQHDEFNIYYEDKVWNEDHGLQEQLVIAMQPRAACLKFRLPYDWAHDPTQTKKYFDGIIYKQAFTSPGSTETRLVPNLWKNGLWKPQYRQYSVTQYERKLAYHNNEIRDDVSGRRKLWRNPVDGSTDVKDDERLINSFDTVYLFYVVDKYLYFINYTSPNRMDAVHSIVNFIIERIEHYGRAGKPYNFNLLRKKVTDSIQRKIQYKPKEQQEVVSGEEILEQTKKTIPVGPEPMKPEFVPLSVKEITFKGLDIDESTLEELI